jgi:hypothetical protein
MQIHTKISGSAVSSFTYYLTPVYWRLWQNNSEGMEGDWSVKWLQPILKYRVFTLSDHYHLSFPATTPMCMYVVSWMCNNNTIHEPIWSGQQQFLNKRKRILYNTGIFKGEVLHILKKPNMVSMCQYWGLDQVLSECKSQSLPLLMKHNQLPKL